MTDPDARSNEGAPTLFSAGTWGSPVVPARRRSGFVAGIAVGLVAAVAVGGAFVLGRTSGAPALVATGAASPTAAPPTTAAPPPASTVQTTEPAAPPTIEPDAAPATTETTAAPPPAEGMVLPLADPAAPVVPRAAVYAGGKVFLRGSVPEVTVAESLVAKVAAVVGPENVVVEYAIDPRAELDQRVPLEVADTVLFEPSSATVTPEFLPLLDLGAALLTQNPAVTMTILGHTDSWGSAEANLLLSKQRVDAVVAELVARNVDPAQVIGVPVGADAPVADNGTEDGRRVNRRVEFRVAGLLDA